MPTLSLSSLLHDPSLLVPLSAHLRLSDLFRLHRALGRTADFSTDVLCLMAQRMHLVPRKHVTIYTLRVHHRHSRCRECGQPCRRTSCVCLDCATDPHSYFAMVDRLTLRARAKDLRVPVRRLLLLCRQDLIVVQRHSAGTLYYWRREAMRALERCPR